MAPSASPALSARFDEVAFRWPAAPQPLLDAWSLSLAPGRITAILGPSGCGKSTLLRLLAGLLQPQAGTVTPGAVAPGACAFAFQRPTLLPWRSVRDNVALPLELAHRPPSEIQERVAEILARVELSPAADQLPGALSGGMQMRASLARAWVTRPGLLLMDKPFAALDALTRLRMYARFQELWEDGRPTVVLVTHDIDEAVLLADRVVVVGGAPLAVRGEVAVELDRPRPAALRHDPRLGALAERVGALL